MFIEILFHLGGQCIILDYIVIFWAAYLYCGQVACVKGINHWFTQFKKYHLKLHDRGANADDVQWYVWQFSISETDQLCQEMTPRLMVHCMHTFH